MEKSKIVREPQDLFIYLNGKKNTRTRLDLYQTLGMLRQHLKIKDEIGFMDKSKQPIESSNEQNLSINEIINTNNRIDTYNKTPIEITLVINNQQNNQKQMKVVSSQSLSQFRESQDIPQESIFLIDEFAIDKITEPLFSLEELLQNNNNTIHMKNLKDIKTYQQTKESQEDKDYKNDKEYQDQKTFVKVTRLTQNDNPIQYVSIDKEINLQLTLQELRNLFLQNQNLPQNFQFITVDGQSLSSQQEQDIKVSNLIVRKSIQEINIAVLFDDSNHCSKSTDMPCHSDIKDPKQQQQQQATIQNNQQQEYAYQQSQQFILQQQETQQYNKQQLNDQQQQIKKQDQLALFNVGGISKQNLLEKRERQTNKTSPGLNGLQTLQREKQFEIYLYQQNRDANINKENAKIIVVIGATGSGKTTLLDSIANYLYGVDINDRFRLKLINEESYYNNSNNKKGKGQDQSESKTQNVVEYYIKNHWIGQDYILIDTPGFMDTKGIERDVQITKEIRKYFQEKLHRIDLIGLVCNSSIVRMTVSQRYVFNKIMEIFGEDIKDNISILSTFCDQGESKALISLREENIPFRDCFKFNNSALYASSESSIYDGFTSTYWKMNWMSMDDLFSKLTQYIPKSLNLTKQVIDKRIQLETVISNLQQSINSQLFQYQSIQEEMKYIESYKDAIDRNRFDFNISIQIFENVCVSTNSQNNNCINCKITCHQDCSELQQNSRNNCLIMNDFGYCSVCPRKCYKGYHQLEKQTYEWKMKEKKIKGKDLQQFCDKNQRQTPLSQQIMDQMRYELYNCQKFIFNSLIQISDCYNDVEKIALKKIKMSIEDIIGNIIYYEQQSRKPGYNERISFLEEIKYKYILLEKEAKSDSNQIKLWTKDYLTAANKVKEIEQRNPDYKTNSWNNNSHNIYNSNSQQLQQQKEREKNKETGCKIF